MRNATLTLTLAALLGLTAACSRHDTEKAHRDTDNTARQAGRDAHQAANELKHDAKQAADQIRDAGKELRQGWEEQKHSDKPSPMQPTRRNGRRH